MTNTIRQTVQSATRGAVPAEYQYMVEGVVTALEQREREIHRVLRQAGINLGARASQIDDALARAGVAAFPAPVTPRQAPAAPQGVSREDARSFLNQLSELVQGALRTVGR